MAPTSFPRISFDEAECIFCGDCAASCPEAVFGPTDGVPWSAQAHIGVECLLSRGIVCRSCTDACEPRALRYRMLADSAGEVSVDDGLCTGCGACVSTCPVTAISMLNGASGT